MDDFDYEAELTDARRGAESLFSFSCDEEDGPVVVSFGRDLENVQIDIVALRTLLDVAEATILQNRERWQKTFGPDSDDLPSG